MATPYDALESVIRTHKQDVLKVLGDATAVADDGKLEKVAALLHPFLPFPVRLVLKKDALAKLLIVNRAKIGALLQG